MTPSPKKPAVPSEAVVALAHERRLSARLLRLIDEAVQYPEGRAVRFEIRTADDVRIAMRLAAIKLES